MMQISIVNFLLNMKRSNSLREIRATGGTWGKQYKKDLNPN
jgi:hypothetical protein